MRELVRHRSALFLQAMAYRARRRIQILRGGLGSGFERRRCADHRHSRGLGKFVQGLLEGRCGSEDLLRRQFQLFANLGFERLHIGVGRSAARSHLGQHAAAHHIQRRRLLLRVHAGVQRLRALGAIAINGHRLDALPPASAYASATSSTVASWGRFTVFEIAPERNGCAAAIILMWPM